eukprot:3440700-Pyramimonas_sp.AAC.1
MVIDNMVASKSAGATTFGSSYTTCVDRQAKITRNATPTTPPNRDDTSTATRTMRGGSQLRHGRHGG